MLVPAGARPHPDEPPDLGALLEVAPAGLAAVDRDLRILVINRALMALSTAGAAASEAPIGLRLTEALPQGTALEEVCREVVASGQPVTGRLVAGGAPSRPGASSCWRIDVHPVGVDGGVVRTLAVAVEDVTEFRRALDVAASLQLLTEELSGAASSDAVLRVALDRARTAVGAAAASIGLVRPGSATLHIVTVGFPGEVADTLARLPVDAALPGPATVRDGRARYFVDRAAAVAEFPDVLGIVERTPFEAAAVQPLVLDGERLGFLSVHFAEPGELDPADLELLAAVARACAAATARVRRSDEERAERDLARRMQSLAGALAVASTADEVAAILAEQTPAVLGATVAIVGIFDPETRSFSLVSATASTPGEIQDRFARWALDAPLPSRDVFSTGEPVIFRSLAERDRLYPALIGVPVAEQAWVQLLLQVQGRRLGTVSFGWPEARDFGLDEVERMEAIAEVCSGALERARLADDQRRIAQALQRSLLPPRLPELPGWQFAARYQPAGAATRAGGDWYDAVVLPGRRVGLLIGDVAGHGIQAAGLMGQVRALARAQARGGAPPGEVLTGLNAAIHDLDTGGDGTFVTCCYLQLDPGSGKLRVASAGHLPPFVRSAGTTDSADGASVAVVDLALGPPLGVRADAGYGTSDASLPPGATVLLFTDGLVEHHDRLLDDGLDKLARRLSTAPAGVDEMCDALLAARLADAVPTDDVALLAVRPPPGT